jgi:pseudouridine-5'-phosphate glycosidase
MPYPQNLETAKEVEAIVRTSGAVPATVAILDGIPCVGVYIKLVLVLNMHLCTLGELTVFFF